MCSMQENVLYKTELMQWGDIIKEREAERYKRREWGSCAVVHGERSMPAYKLIVSSDTPKGAKRSRGRFKLDDLRFPQRIVS